ncbi:hypothetical protein ACQ86D_33970 [Streptomyces galilaeus]
MTTPVTLDDQIAALLRAGTTYQRIAEQLHVGTRRVWAVRVARGIPLPPERAKRSRAEVAAQFPRAVELLRAGASYEDIRAETRLTLNRIAELRRQHKIPTPRAHLGASQRFTVDQAFARYAQPGPEGHLIWTGPVSGRSLDLLAGGRKYNARVVAFQRHYGREPEGRLWRTCKNTACIAGAHHTDLTIRTGATS